MPRDAEPAARNLLSQILVLEPNLRLPISEIKKHKYFADVDWTSVMNRKLEPVPYKPDPDKYKYLMQQREQFETISNLNEKRHRQTKKTYFLGDLSLYKINKVFADF